MTFINTQATNPTSYSSLPALPGLPSAAPAAQVGVQADQFTQNYSATGSLPALPGSVQFQQAPSSNYSPFVPTLSTLNISSEALQWATDFEARVQQGHQPTQQEVDYYQSLAGQLSMLRNNIQPMSPAPALPQLPYQPVAPTGQQQPQPQSDIEAEAFAPNMPPLEQQVTMSEIEWALMLEEKVQKYGYTPTHDEEVRYKNILTRFKNNQEIKMEFLDSLAAQSPWVGANVASIRYSKVAASQVSNVVKAIKSGQGSVVGSLKSLGGTVMKSTGLSALVSGGFSAVTNGIAYWQGKKTATQAVSNVVTDTVSGAATGLGATLAGGAAMAALAGTSVAGFGLTLLVGGASILGGYLTDKLFTSSGAKEWVKSKVISVMDGLNKKDEQAAPQQAAQQQQPTAMQQGYQQAAPQYPTYPAFN